MRLGRRPSAAVLAVVGLTLLGAALRLGILGQSVISDELSTQWIVASNGLGRVLSLVHSDAEITPPLFFVLSWLTTQLGVTGELLRAPSMVAGIALIPLVHALGVRTVGRAAGLVAAALVALSPFLIFYSTEARGYAVMVTLVMLSTLALLRAVDGDGRRWWFLYAVSTCAAMYTHYTAAFALAAQLVWLLVVHPGARRPALLANAGAVVLFLPWASGLVNDLTSPTTQILSKLEPFNLHSVVKSVEHWSIGHPYAFPNTGLRSLPGTLGLVLLAVGIVAAVAGLALRTRAHGGSRPPRLDARLVLVLALALSVPVGEAAASVLSTNLFGVRNLAVAWPACALSLAALLTAAGGRLRIVAAVLVLASFALGAIHMLEPPFRRVDFEAVANYIDRTGTRDDVVIDRAVLSPGPLSPLEVALGPSRRVFREGRPQERDHPFNTYDPTLSIAEVDRMAVKAAAPRRRIFIVSLRPTPQVPPALTSLQSLPAGYHRVGSRSYRGIIGLTVSVYAPR